VNVTDDPAQTVVLAVVIDTEGVTLGFTVIVIALLVAGLPVTPGRFEVITQVTTCPLVSAVVV
jgi:hypothetical protein